MTKAQFYKAFYESRKTKTSEAAKLVLVECRGVREASRIFGLDHSRVSKLVSKIKEAS